MHSTQIPNLFRAATPSATRSVPLGQPSENLFGHAMDLEKIAQGVRLILEGLAEDPDRPGLIDTPARVARMYSELCYAIGIDPAKEITCEFSEEHDQLILVKDIRFASICEHHLVPFVGFAHLAYTPQSGRITGLSKLARVVEAASKRPQVQERMTGQIAEAMMSRLNPQGVMVVLEAEHFCMSIRGINKPGSKTVTTAVRGSFKDNSSARAEVMAYIQKA